MIILSTDSGSDVSKEFAKKHNIYVAPMKIIMNDETLNDGEFPISDIFEYYEKTKKIPTTSAINPNGYAQLFEKITAENPGCKILHLAYSSAASSSCHNAMTAAQEFDNVYVVDSLNVAAGIGIILENAVEMMKKYEDCEIDLLIAEIKELTEKVSTSFIPSTLDYLLAGGRVSNAAYISANLLKIRPVIEIRDGFLVPAKKYRGKINKIVKDFWVDFINSREYEKNMIYVIYSLGIENGILEEITEKAKAAGFKKVYHSLCSCVITTHGGPGVVGLSAICKDKL